jgi:predicted naringenin-chalcone synthase
MNVGITSIGLATPIHVATRDQSIEHAIERCASSRQHKAFLRRIHAGSGIESRGAVVLADGLLPPAQSTDDRGPGTERRLEAFAEEAPDLAARAAEQAVQLSPIDASDFTHLITVSCTGFAAPGVDIELIDRLRLPRNIERTHIGFMGCHGAINGIRVARAVARENQDSKVLLCCVELCSLHFQYGWRRDQVVANTLFADGAAAAVVESAQHAPSVSVQSTASIVIPNSKDAMSWSVGDHGFEMTLSLDAPAALAEHLAPWLDDWLGARGLNRSEVTGWAVHPGGPGVLDTIERALELGSDDLVYSRAVLREHGNMSSATLLFILERMMNRVCGPIVALAFGPGLTIEGALLNCAPISPADAPMR